MFKNVLLVLLAAAVLTGIIIVNRDNCNMVCFENNCFEVEIASSGEEKKQGLKNRKSLSPNEGMLFIYPEQDQRSFWMKDVLIPLDIIWIDSSKKAVFIKKNAQPCKENCIFFKPEQKAKYVLELKGGTCEKIGLKQGNKLNFDL